MPMWLDETTAMDLAACYATLSEIHRRLAERRPGPQANPKCTAQIERAVQACMAAMATAVPDGDWWARKAEEVRQGRIRVVWARELDNRDVVAELMQELRAAWDEARPPRGGAPGWERFEAAVRRRLEVAVDVNSVAGCSNECFDRAFGSSEAGNGG